MLGLGGGSWGAVFEAGWPPCRTVIEPVSLAGVGFGIPTNPSPAKDPATKRLPSRTVRRCFVLQAQLVKIRYLAIAEDECSGNHARVSHDKHNLDINIRNSLSSRSSKGRPRNRPRSSCRREPSTARLLFTTPGDEGCSGVPEEAGRLSIRDPLMENRSLRGPRALAFGGPLQMLYICMASKDPFL